MSNRQHIATQEPLTRDYIEGVPGVLPKLVEPDGQQAWQLGIDQELPAMS